MKKIILIAGIFLIISFTQEKKYKIELRNVTKMIDSLQSIIRVQYINQVDTTKKK